MFTYHQAFINTNYMPGTGIAKGKQGITSLTGSISWVYFMPGPT